VDQCTNRAGGRTGFYEGFTLKFDTVWHTAQKGSFLRSRSASRCMRGGIDYSHELKERHSNRVCEPLISTSPATSTGTSESIKRTYAARMSHWNVRMFKEHSSQR